MSAVPAALTAAATVVALLLPSASTRSQTESKPAEAWFDVTVAGYRVGVVHEVIEGKADTLVARTIVSEIAVERLGERVEMTQRDVWTETTDGRPLEYSSVRTMAEGEEIVLHVAAAPGRLEVRKTTARGSDEWTIPFAGELLFPTATERLHAERGFVPGDSYAYATFDPDFEEASKCSVVVAGRETLAVAGRQQALNLIEVRPDVYEGAVLREWRDDSGALWLQDIAALGVVTRRTTGEAARERPKPPDVVVGTMIATNTDIPRPLLVDDALYEVWVDGGDVEDLVAGDLRQTIEGRTERGVLLRVRRTTPDFGQSGVRPPDGGFAEYLEGNVLLQKDDPDVRGAALDAVEGGEGDPWSKAVRIERKVFELVSDRGFGSAFASAAEVVDSSSGDCSEHAILAAAMARAAGVPSRLATGVVHFRGGFAYHMWVEVWAGDGWYALDPTQGLGSVDATHIRLGGSSLAGGRVGELSLPVLRTVNRLGIDVVEYTEVGRTVRVR